MGEWFKNDAGRVVCVSPWRLVDYWQWVLGRHRTETRPWVFPDVSTGDACIGV